MRKFVYVSLTLGLLAMAVSCSSLAEGAISGALGAVVPTGGGGVGAIGSAAAVVDFQSGEILASADSRTMFDASFDVAKILTPASPATKNQAEALWISDGKKQWVNFVVGSRKATKADLIIGAPVFYLAGWANHDKISADAYRKDYLAPGQHHLRRAAVQEPGGDIRRSLLYRVPPRSHRPRKVIGAGQHRNITTRCRPLTLLNGISLELTHI